MKAPICRLCHNAHWNNEQHVFSAAQQAEIGNVTTGVTGVLITCNQCVTKDAEIERLRNQLARAVRTAEALLPAEAVKKAKRDRAEYMRDYRSRK